MGHTKDISSKESKANKKKYAEMAQKLREKAPAAVGRPLNWMEQQSLQTIFAIGEFPDVAKGVLGPRLDTIRNSKQRLGIIQWAARSLFEDCIKQLTPDQADRFVKTAQVMRCEVHPAGISKAPRTKDETIVNCQDLYALVESVYRHECMMCSKKGREVKKCGLKKALDAMMILTAHEEASEGDCWYQL